VQLCTIQHRYTKIKNRDVVDNAGLTKAKHKDDGRIKDECIENVDNPSCGHEDKNNILCVKKKMHHDNY